MQLGDTLVAIASQYRAAGFDFAWHNHDFEFKQLPDGQWPMKLLPNHDDIGWEIDLAWVVRAKSDPLVWIQNYGPRLRTVHLKDLAPMSENADEDGWSDVGFGTMNWAQLLPVLQQTPTKWCVMEHDKPNDLERFAKRSLATANKLVQ